MNEFTLTQLVSLFAIFNSAADGTDEDRQNAREIVLDYMRGFYGIQDYQTYIDIYDNLCFIYRNKEFDLEATIEKISGYLKGRIDTDYQALMVLRFMEFAFVNSVIDAKERMMIDMLAQKFDIGDEVLAEYYNFIQGRASSCVGVAPLGNGHLKVMRLAAYNWVVVAYVGSDALRLNGRPFYKNLFLLWPENGIITSSNTLPIDYKFVSHLLGEEARYKAISMEGKNVNFRFPGSNNGLHNLSFHLHSGEFVAIMGGSGVGKSTMLSILNGSLRPDTGSLTINGLALYDHLDLLKKYIGFVPQDDLLVAELTVFENLYYTARFCFAQLTDAEITERVNKTLHSLDLTDTKDLKVGSPLNKTISGGQRKRLNIALELIREPAILFLDEPTSGLSSSDSEKVVHLLKDQTYQGRLVVINIHQPSSNIYKLFDRLWLLDRGGYPIYDGNPIEAPTIFKLAADYVTTDSAVCQHCGNINPEIMLDIIDERSLDSTGRPTEKRKIEPEVWHQRYLERQADEAVPTAPEEPLPLPPTDQRRPSAFRQFCIYLQRNLRTKATDKQFLAIALAEAPLLAFIVALLTHYSGDNGYTVFYNKNLLSYFFMAIIVATFMGMSICAEEIFKDRALLKREKFLRLSHSAYIASKIVFTALVTATQTGLFILVGNHLQGLTDLWLEWWLILFATSFLAGLTGLLLSQSLNSVVAIYITIPLLLIPQILLCGLVVPYDDLNQHSRTRNVPWVGEVIPSRWAYEALAVTAFTRNDYTRHFFADEAAQYEYQLDRIGFLSTLKERAIELELAQRQRKAEADADQQKTTATHLAMLRRETQRLTDKRQLPPFAQLDELAPGRFTPEVATAYKRWIAAADSALYRRSQQHTRAIDRTKQQLLDRYGLDYLVALQENHCNKNLQNTLTNTAATSLVKQEGDCLVPYVGTVYLAPTNPFGRAPFYSSRK
ncbi:MAG: ATP-binding cassette domain-containing protein, partial [Bacteroidaceae bacterium]|nr:ATP-binding cassette domain-containing protein [Bacteroidaceae bacterium]